MKFGEWGPIQPSTNSYTTYNLVFKAADIYWAPAMLQAMLGTEVTMASRA